MAKTYYRCKECEIYKSSREFEKIFLINLDRGINYEATCKDCEKKK